jgi:hypothetical protein
MSVCIYKSSRCHNSEVHCLNYLQCEKPKTQKPILILVCISHTHVHICTVHYHTLAVSNLAVLWQTEVMSDTYNVLKMVDEWLNCLVINCLCCCCCCCCCRCGCSGYGCCCCSCSCYNQYTLKYSKEISCYFFQGFLKFDFLSLARQLFLLYQRCYVWLLLYLSWVLLFLTFITQMIWGRCFCSKFLCRTRV